MQKRYVCERLTSHSENKTKIESFSNKRNKNLEDYLKFYAWEDDRDGSNAVYVILDQEENNEIAMYFSLKCGAIGLSFIESVYPFLIEDGLANELPKNSRIYFRYMREFLAESRRNTSVKKIPEVVSGIELAHFCMNDTYCIRLTKKKQNPKGLGEYFFYNEIFPIVKKIRKLASCKILYLFAADSSKNQSLISYYRDHLNFYCMDEIDKKILNNRALIPIMPFYDYQCEFMVYPFTSEE